VASRLRGRIPWGAATTADKVENVESDTTGGLLGCWHVWVVGLKVAIEDVVVPVSLAAGGPSLGELDVQPPSTRGRPRLTHFVLPPVVVP